MMSRMSWPPAGLAVEVGDRVRAEVVVEHQDIVPGVGGPTFIVSLPAPPVMRVVAVAAVQRVVAGSAVDDVVADSAVDDVVAAAGDSVSLPPPVDSVSAPFAGLDDVVQGVAVARAVDGGVRRQGEVARRRRRGCSWSPRSRPVGAAFRRFRHHVAGVVDDVGVVAAAAGHGVGPETAVRACRCRRWCHRSGCRCRRRR